MPRGDRFYCAQTDALLCAGKVSASWQVEGSSFRVELSNYLEANYMLEGRGTDRDRCGAAAAAARDGRRGPKQTGQRAS